MKSSKTASRSSSRTPRPRSKAIILWDSRDAADAAEGTLEERRRTMVDQVGLTIESVDLYEAPVVELAHARV